MASQIHSSGWSAETERDSSEEDEGTLAGDSGDSTSVAHENEKKEVD